MITSEFGPCTLPPVALHLTDTAFLCCTLTPPTRAQVKYF